jgi:hypothetical protein
MRNKFVLSFLSLIALATGGLVAGCDSDASIAKSAVGESCDKTADCDDGLKCVQGVCYKASSIIDNNGGNDGGGGEPAVVVPPKPNLGGVGETCTKRADCEDGLACIAERCTEEGGSTGEGGAGPTGPTLGGPGETCGLTSDCSEGLKCLPNGYNIYGDIRTLAIGSNSIGVCTPIDSDIEPTGKTCGHECAEAADCCELPVAYQTTLGAKSCADLAMLVADVTDCATATAATGGRACLAYDVYCKEKSCGNAWACNAGVCSYTAKCTKTTEVVGGCPTYTRGGNLVPTCDTKTSKCQAPAVATAGCTKDSECLDEVVGDDATDTCSEDECVCHATTGKCYRKCSEDLDCAYGFRCDDDSTLCVPVDSCSEDVQCVTRTGDSRATCVKGVCKAAPCEHDIDCNPSGLVNGAFQYVCNKDKACVALSGQCSTSDECGPYGGGTVRSFCAEPTVLAVGVAPKSAITD